MLTRTLLRLFLMAGLFAPMCAFALGVGPIEVRSTLSQLFEADIPLIVSNPAELTGLVVRIPRQQEFDQAGIERLALLSKLKFKVESPPGGPNIIKVTSTEAIREPNFSFILEVIWPRGRLIREFAVQLDPELYANRRQPAPPPAAAPPPVTAPPVAAKPPRAAPTLPPAPTVSFEGASLYGPVKRGDTLAAIAGHLRPGSSLSRPQIMAILLAGNPQAFTGGDPSKLRAGATLKVPTPQALGMQGAPAALTTAEPPSATPPPPSEPTPAPAIVVPPATSTPTAPPIPTPVVPEARTPEAVPPTPPPATPVPAGPPPVATSPAPTEPLREITPKAITPQPESAPPPPVSTTTTPAPTVSPPVTPPSIEKPVTPPPATKPAVPQPESEASWLANPVVWLAIGLIGLAVAAVVLLPLLRRPARPKAPAAGAEAASAGAPEAKSVPTQRTTRESRSVRPLPAVAAGGAAAGIVVAAATSQPTSTTAAAPPPKPIDEMLKDIDFGTSGETVRLAKSSGATSAEQGLHWPLPDVEPPTTPVSTLPMDELLVEPPTASTGVGSSKAKVPASPEPPSELRLDGLNLELSSLEFMSRRSSPTELPPLELKTARPASTTPAAVEQPRLQALEQGPATQPVLATPAASDLKFEFSDVSREYAAHGNPEEPLRLDEDLKTLGLDTLNMDTVKTNGLGGGIGSSEAAADYVETKLDLASAYLDMGDQVGARSLLEDVIREGDTSQKQRAEALLKKLG
ncbi:MAG: FimV/HubP family polar landmark protein [Candidatus Competibacteraceae bacterium]